MPLAQQIDEDLKAALKARDALKTSALRMVKAASSNAAIQKGKPALEDPELLEVIGKLIKQREESVEAFTRGGRKDLAEKESREMAILRAYLPPALTDEELRSLIRSVIQELGASGPSAMGAVMKAVMPKVAGRADGKAVSELVRQALQRNDQ